MAGFWTPVGPWTPGCPALSSLSIPAISHFRKSSRQDPTATVIARSRRYFRFPDNRQFAPLINTSAFSDTDLVKLPPTGLLGRVSKSPVTVASWAFALEIRSAPRHCLTPASSRSLITQHFFLLARAIQPE